eukprot:1424729-Amphidinium_carterae.1
MAIPTLQQAMPRTSSNPSKIYSHENESLLLVVMLLASRGHFNLGRSERQLQDSPPTGPAALP